MYNSDENNNDMKQYVSSVLDINGEEFLHIGMPLENGLMVPLQREDNYRVCIYTKRGLYQCYGLVVDRYQEGVVHVAILRIRSGLVRQQRRQFYRLEKLMDIQCGQFIDEADSEEPLDYEWENAIMTDISGGGARFNSDCRFDVGSLVLLKLVLPLQVGHQEFILKAKVISSQMILNRIGWYETRVEFSQIDLSQREAVIRYIFEEERKQRRREKGLV